ncbi:MAG: class I SAM-dependent methyltransferase [Nanoarchaeota archaeon]|nr:class I SAM-dependent methyltransferase [Nanoarchaeota archaeon]
MEKAIWRTVTQVAKAIERGQSVVGTDVRDFYEQQVSQYPLYDRWYEKVMEIVENGHHGMRVLEYGPGTGRLASMLMDHPKVSAVTVVEPERQFREIIEEATGGRVNIVPVKAEKYVSRECVDLVVAMASYHHFEDKPTALRNASLSMRSDGLFIIADTFLQPYGFDQRYSPTDREEFADRVMEHAAEQIMAMPELKREVVEDQIRTAILDMLRRGELKVSVPILETQLEQAGFRDVNIEKMIGDDPNVDYDKLGWHFITAKR